jgi:hypothetical protein
MNDLKLYAQGYDDHFIGKTVSDNPHSGGDGRVWLMGWLSREDIVNKMRQKAKDEFYGKQS